MSAPRKLSFVKLHEPFQQPGTPLSTLSKTLSDKGVQAMDMWYTLEGVEVSYHDYKFIIPLANVAGATFAKENNK